MMMRRLQKLLMNNSFENEDTSMIGTVLPVALMPCSAYSCFFGVPKTSTLYINMYMLDNSRIIFKATFAKVFT